VATAVSVVVVDDTRVSTDVAVDTSVEEKIRVSMVVLVASTVAVDAVAVGIVTIDVVGVTPRQLQARERREAGWCSRFPLTMEAQVAVAVRFFFFSVCGGFTKVLEVVTEVRVSVVRVVESSVVVVSVVVVVDVVDVSMTVDESTGVTVVRVVVTGSTARKPRQNSTACSSNSPAQAGDTFREQVKYRSTPSTEHVSRKLGRRAAANGSPRPTTPKI